MAETKGKARRGEGVIDLTWIPTEDTCVACKRTLQLCGPFDGLFGSRMDGTKWDEYEEWHLPFIAMVRACRACVPAEGLVFQAENGHSYRLLPGELVRRLS